MDAQTLLKNALRHMENELSPATITTWFDDARAERLEDDTLVLVTPSEFKRDIIAERYLKALEQSLSALKGRATKAAVYAGSAPPASGAQTGDGDDYEYSFERFVVGPSNKFAHAAALAISNRPATTYNPLFLYGGSGLGKTHLLYAIAHQVRKKHRNFNIVYIKGDDFLNEFISNIQTKTNVEFRNKYRQADLLLVDDIQFIAGKVGTMEEFFHTFNVLYEDKRQIVLTSDRPPKEIYTLEERLKTRFEWGLLADIQPPDYETRMAIIKDKAQWMGLDISNELISTIANSITANVRQLEGTVKKILAYRDLLNMDVNMDAVNLAIRDMFKDNPGLKPTTNMIIEEVSRFFGINADMIRGANRRKDCVTPRHVAMYIMREITDLSLPEIGREFGRDHTTVIHALNKLEGLIRRDDPVKNQIKDLITNIREN